MDVSSIIVELGYHFMGMGLVMYGLGKLGQILFSEPEDEEQTPFGQPQIIVITPIQQEQEEHEKEKCVSFKVDDEDYMNFKREFQELKKQRVEAHRELDEKLNAIQKAKILKDHPKFSTVTESQKAEVLARAEALQKEEEAISNKPKTTTTEYIDLTGGDSDTETQILSQD